jgi:elongation factor G
VSGHFTSFFEGTGTGTGTGGQERSDPGYRTGHSDHDEDERIGALSFPLGKRQRIALSVVAGDICAIGRLSRAETGDTLSDRTQPLVLQPWTMPEPLLPIAVEPHAKTDETSGRRPATPRRRRPDAANRPECRDAPDRAVVHG